MTEPEGFLSRWTRLKRESAAPGEAAPREAHEQASAPTDDSREAHLSAEPTESTPAIATMPEVDLSALPPLESITAATDIRGFLAPGVPPELTRAALRRAWVADPHIRDFIGIAENQWDFTAENAMGGFGPLGPLDDVRRLVTQVIGEQQNEPDVTSSAKTPENPQPEIPQSVANSATSAASCRADDHAREFPNTAVSAEPHAVDREPAVADGDAKVDIALQQEVAKPAPVGRSHGGALPK